MKLTVKASSGNVYSVPWYFDGETNMYIGTFKVNRLEQETKAHSLDGLLRSVVNEIDFVESLWRK